jgi:hypothetical protein
MEDNFEIALAAYGAALEGNADLDEARAALKRLCYTLREKGCAANTVLEWVIRQGLSPEEGLEKAKGELDALGLYEGYGEFFWGGVRLLLNKKNFRELSKGEQAQEIGDVFRGGKYAEDSGLRTAVSLWCLRLLFRLGLLGETPRLSQEISGTIDMAGAGERTCSALPMVMVQLAL